MAGAIADSGLGTRGLISLHAPRWQTVSPARANQGTSVPQIPRSLSKQEVQSLPSLFLSSPLEAP